MSQKRVIFRAPPSFDETSSVFVEVLPGDKGLQIKLLYDYPDLKPEKGWRVEADGLYEIKSVKENVIQCEQMPRAEMAGAQETDDVEVPKHRRNRSASPASPAIADESSTS